MAAKVMGELSCHICFNLLTDARTLSCGHSFCYHCLIEASFKDKKCVPCLEETVPEPEQCASMLPNSDLNHKVGSLIRQGTSIEAVKDRVLRRSTFDI